MQKKSFLFLCLLNSSPHQGTLPNLLATPGTLMYYVPQQLCAHVLCRDVSSWPQPPRVWAFVLQSLFSDFFSLPSWLQGLVIFSPPLPCVSLCWMCSVLFTCQASLQRNASLFEKGLSCTGSGLREALALSRSSWLFLFKASPDFHVLYHRQKPSHITRHKIMQTIKLESESRVHHDILTIYMQKSRTVTAW